MEPLPDLQFQLSSYLLTPSESALIEQSKQELSDLLLHKIDDIKDRFSSIASNTLQEVTHTFQKEILSQADSLLNLSIKPIDLSQSKKILQTFQHSIESLERLIFLSRYFNPDNDEEYLKNLGPRAIKLTKMIYNLNNYIFTWITALLENTQFDPKDMLPILLDSKEKGINAVSNDLLIVKLPSRSLNDISSPSSALLLDYYYLNLTYQNINRLIETFTKYKVPENIKNIVHSFKEETGSNSPALLRLGESFINSNPVTLELTRELENLKKSKENMHTLGCLYEPKGLLDKSVQNVAQYEGEIRTVAEKYISQAFARREDTISDQEEIPLEKIDEVVVQEIQGNCNNDRDKLKDFLKGWEAESKAEILRMLGRQKEMLQDHMSKYIEERLVTFQQGKGDFANVNFAKLVQEFCSTAKKEYKKVLPARTDQEYEIWPLYYCYVAENQCDFYLVEYMTDSTALRVYLTAAPMLSTLYKHLSKLDMAKIGKKNVLVTILNYYDMDVNLEFRQIFRSGEALEVDNSKQNKISQGIKDLIFITVFLLYNTPSQPLSEINLTAKDFAAFFNYTADFHLIYHQYLNSFPGGVPPQGKSNTTSPTLSPQKKPFASFDFRAPFIDLNQPKNMFLIHYKGELSRENSVLIMRNMVQQYGEGLQYQYLTIDEEMNRPDFLDVEIAKYLKKGETKIAYNFDGTEYLSTYLRRKNPQEAPITIISKKHSQKLLDMFRSEAENRELLLDLEDYSKYARLYLIFSYTGDNFPGLMIYADRKTRTVSIYRHTRQTVEENDVLRDFASFVGKLFGLEESMMYLKQVRCIIKEDLVLKHLKNYYFPYACLVDSSNEGLEGDIVDLNITMDHLINSFKDFMAINLGEKSLEAFKACNLVVEEKSKAALKTINLGTILKFNRLKTTLIALAEKIAQEKVQYMLVSFNFVGATGYKTYYIYFKETSGSPEETGYGLQSPGLQTVNGKVRYIVDIYTLESNLPQDDQEVLVIVAHVCQTVTSPGLFLNAAYIIKAKHNILLYNQVDLTLNTLTFLAQLGNIPMEKAFSRISRSVVSHYDVLEGFLDQISVLTQAPSSFFVKQRSLSAPQNSEVFDMSSGKIMDPQGRLARVRASLLKKVTMLDSFFEDLPAQAVFKKNVDTQALELLQTNEARYFTEGFDIYNFLDSLNAEDNPTPGFYSYAVDEQVMRKLLTNEGSVVKNVSKFLIEEVISSKESQEVKYPETLLFFLVSPSLFDISKVILITYNVERAESTFFYTKQFTEQREPRSRLNLTQGGIEEEDAEQQSSERIRENIVTISKGESRDYIASRENVGHDHHEEMKTSERSKDYSRTDDFSALEQSGFLKHDGHDYGVPENLRKLMESFSQVAAKNKKTKDKPRARYFELSFDQNVTKMLKSQYALVVKFLMHYFTHQGTKQKSSSLHITTSMFNGFLCDFADRLFVSYIETSRIMENSKMLCNMFLEKNNPLGKKIALLAFLNGRANVEQIGVIENCIKSFKQDFQKIYGIENAFFCFTINMKQSYKHFLLHLSGKSKKNLTLNIFTNGTSDADGVVDKMIRTYCLEEATTGGEDILIGKLQVYNMNMPNVLFMKYSEITTVLVANAVCNDVEDAVGYCANLAYSPVHYLKELRDFEDKCDKLGILLDIQRTTSQASFASQMSPT